ncbi:hypothetical protein Syun_007158 [Stephania yunnanensis]|uniref:Uncharacterized protein n=1 Tax=Stephania yunnanensis TaxID=152371 RepID=A0AAP0KZQ3_9MAGN
MTTNEDEAGCDELFGDCKFVSSSNNSNQQQHNEDENDWGDFVDNFSNSNNNHDFFPSHSSDGFNNLSVNGFFGGQNPSGGAYDATRDPDPFDSSCVESDVNLNSGSAVEKRCASDQEDIRRGGERDIQGKRGQGKKMRLVIIHSLTLTAINCDGEEEAEEVVAEMEKPCFGVGGDDQRNLESEFGYCVRGNLQFPC